MTRRLVRPLLMAAMALAASLGVGRSAQATSRPISIFPRRGEFHLTYSNSGSRRPTFTTGTTYYLEESGNQRETVRASEYARDHFRPTTMYSVKVNYPHGHGDEPIPAATAELIAVVGRTTPKSGSQTSKSDLLAVTDVRFRLHRTDRLEPDAGATGGTLRLDELLGERFGFQRLSAGTGSYVDDLNASDSRSPTTRVR